jgi:hypothetical protein
MNRLLTFSRRASNRGNRVLALFFVAFLALAASCGSDYQPCPDCPGAPALIPGNFLLTGVDGNTLPFTVPNSTTVILGGDCVVTATDDKFTMHLTTTTTGGKDTVTTAASGFILPFNKGSVTFAFSASSVQATAIITGDGFALTYQGVALQFARQG